MCQNSVFAKFWVIKNEVFEKKIAFFVFLFLCWKIETEKSKKKKQKRENSKKPYKNRFFFKVVMQKCEKIKKMFFLQKLADTICVRKGEKTRIFVHTICFGQKFFWPKTV